MAACPYDAALRLAGLGVAAYAGALALALGGVVWLSGTTILIWLVEVCLCLWSASAALGLAALTLACQGVSRFALVAALRHIWLYWGAEWLFGSAVVVQSCTGHGGAASAASGTSACQYAGASAASGAIVVASSLAVGVGNFDLIECESEIMGGSSVDWAGSHYLLLVLLGGFELTAYGLVGVSQGAADAGLCIAARLAMFAATGGAIQWHSRYASRLRCDQVVGGVGSLVGSSGTASGGTG